MNTGIVSQLGTIDPALAIDWPKFEPYIQHIAGSHDRRRPTVDKDDLAQDLREQIIRHVRRCPQALQDYEPVQIAVYAFLQCRNRLQHEDVRWKYTDHHLEDTLPSGDYKGELIPDPNPFTQPETWLILREAQAHAHAQLLAIFGDELPALYTAFLEADNEDKATYKTKGGTLNLTEMASRMHTTRKRLHTSYRNALARYANGGELPRRPRRYPSRYAETERSRQAVYDFYAQHPNASSTQAAAHIGCSCALARLRRRELEQAGRLPRRDAERSQP